MEAVIIGGISSFWAVAGWFLICNDRTYKQRVRMIGIVHDHNISMIEAHRFSMRHCYPDDLVSYNGHLFRLFAFMNPKKTYAKRGWSLGF